MKWPRFISAIILALASLGAAPCLWSQSNSAIPFPTNIWNAVIATGTATSNKLINPGFDQAGTLIITWAGITGSPSGCTFQVKSADSLGNLINNGSTIAVTPANGTTSQQFIPASTLLNAPQEEVVFACSVYPSAGTLTLEFVPEEMVYLAGIQGNAAVVSGQQAVTGSAVVLATNTLKNICVKALIANTINVYVGPSGITTSTGYELGPGQGVCMPVTNSNLLYVIASTTGASVGWIGTN